MDPKHLRLYIVRPALESIGMHSPAAENLVLGTAAQESKFRWVRQHGNGPALGLFQMEPATHGDIWSSYLRYKPTLGTRIRKAIQIGILSRPEADRLMWDFRYAAIMCRVHYRRVKDPLPDEHDVWAMGHYWKDFYNTHHGRGTVEEFVDSYALVK